MEKFKTGLIENDRMYLIDKAGRILKKIKNSSVKTKWSWFRFGKHDYCFYQDK